MKPDSCASSVYTTHRQTVVEVSDYHLGCVYIIRTSTLLLTQEGDSYRQHLILSLLKQFVSDVLYTNKRLVKVDEENLSTHRLFSSLAVQAGRHEVDQALAQQV